MTRKPGRTTRSRTAGPVDKTAETRDFITETLRGIMADATAPAAARAQAARTLAEMVGALGRHSAPPGDADTKPVAELSRAELEAGFGADCE